MRGRHQKSKFVYRGVKKARKTRKDKFKPETNRRTKWVK